MTLDELSQLYLNHKCPSGKVPHATVADAELSANHMARVHSTPQITMRFSVYSCELCGMWHISTERPMLRSPLD